MPQHRPLQVGRRAVLADRHARQPSGRRFHLGVSIVSGLLRAAHTGRGLGSPRRSGTHRGDWAVRGRSVVWQLVIPSGSLVGMTAKVTLSFSDETIADARRLAQRDGVSLSAWIDKAARERALRELFTAHAEAVKRSGIDIEAAALADERELELVDAAMYPGQDA